LNWDPADFQSDNTIGVLPGEGVGPEIVDVSIQVLKALTQGTAVNFNIKYGGEIGLPAVRSTGHALSAEVVSFVESIFASRGAVFCGAGGGRFVYDLRDKFDLYCKLTPLHRRPALLDIGCIKADALEGIDALVIRENSGGIYFGQWDEQEAPEGTRALHSFSYCENEVKRILRIAVKLAESRRGRLDLILKPYGMPSISRLWTQMFNRLVQDSGIDSRILEVDYAAYYMIDAAKDLDVVVCPNLFGDILSDLGGVLIGSRGMCFSGNYGEHWKAVYQTGHGAAWDLAGRDESNPIGQLDALTMMLRVSFGQRELALRLEQAIDLVLQAGFRTPDIASPGSTVVGTRELGRRIAEAAVDLNGQSAA
jgi:3-isopropylmalate dehydrogenase